MRILLTGMTKMQANRPRRREYNTSINALYHALLAAKHTVEWRPLEFDEKRLDARYDLVILGLGTISEFSCTYLYEALLASKFANVVYLVNDWKANATIKLLMEGDIMREFVFRNNTGNRLDKRVVHNAEAKLEKAREKMFKDKELIGPFFEGWGNRQIILEGTPFNSIHEFDPSCFYLKRWGRVELPKVRAKQWVYGALADYSKWHTRLEASWPILSFNKKTFVPEDQLVREHYAKSIGMIMPRYKASGSGWWRARYCHAVICDSVIYADQKEVQDIHEDFWMHIMKIESRGPKELKEIQQFQKAQLYKNMPKWPYVVDTVNEIVNAMEKVGG